MSSLKDFFSAIFTAFGTFSTLPVPRVQWKESSTSLLMPLFPIVGGVLGVLWYFSLKLLLFLSLPQLISAAFFCILPIIFTGFFHMDGFMDVSDAVLSRAPLEKRRQILKDPHVGSFAVLSTVLYFIFYFSAGYEIILSPNSAVFLGIFIFLPIFSRCLCGIFLLSFPLISSEGYAAIYRKNASKKQLIWLVFLLIICLSLCSVLFGLIGMITLLIGLFSGFITCFLVYLSLKGVNGDVSGCTLIITELSCIVSLAVLLPLF